MIIVQPKTCINVIILPQVLLVIICLQTQLKTEVNSPTTIGEMIAKAPGFIISLNDADATIATQRA